MLEKETLEHFIERIEPIVYTNDYEVKDLRDKTINFDHRISYTESISNEIESANKTIASVIDSLKADIDILNKKLNKVIKFLPDDVKLCLELTDENGDVD